MLDKCTSCKVECKDLQSWVSHLLHVLLQWGKQDPNSFTHLHLVHSFLQVQEYITSFNTMHVGGRHSGVGLSSMSKTYPQSRGSGIDSWPSILCPHIQPATNAERNICNRKASRVLKSHPLKPILVYDSILWKYRSYHGHVRPITSTM